MNNYVDYLKNIKRLSGIDIELMRIGKELSFEDEVKSKIYNRLLKVSSNQDLLNYVITHPELTKTLIQLKKNKKIEDIYKNIIENIDILDYIGVYETISKEVDLIVLKFCEQIRGE